MLFRAVFISAVTRYTSLECTESISQRLISWGSLHPVSRSLSRRRESRPERKQVRRGWEKRVCVLQRRAREVGHKVWILESLRVDQAGSGLPYLLVLSKIIFSPKSFLSSSLLARRISRSDWQRSRSRRSRKRARGSCAWHRRVYADRRRGSWTRIANASLASTAC